MTTQSLKTATELAAEGRYEEAARVAEQRVRRAPNDPQGWYVLSQVTDDPEYAVRCMEKVVRLRPYDSRAVNQLEEMQKRLEDSDFGQLYKEFDTLAAQASALAVQKKSGLNPVVTLLIGVVLGVVATVATLQLMGLLG